AAGWAGATRPGGVPHRTRRTGDDGACTAIRFGAWGINPQADVLAESGRTARLALHHSRSAIPSTRSGHAPQSCGFKARFTPSGVPSSDQAYRDSPNARQSNTSAGASWDRASSHSRSPDRWRAIAAAAASGDGHCMVDRRPRNCMAQWLLSLKSRRTPTVVGYSYAIATYP